MEKININEFENIKNRLFTCYNNAEKYVEENQTTSDFDVESYIKDVIKEYVEIEEELLKYDLSDIPFESWDGMLLFSNDNETLDFSNTHANIDFSLVNSEGTINFRNCKIKNMDKYRERINPEYFDESVKRENKDIFIPATFSEVFYESYHNYKLDIDSLASLSDEQYEMLNEKEVMKRLKIDGINSSVLDIIELKKLVDLYKYSKDDYYKAINCFNNYAVFNYYVPNTLVTFHDFKESLRAMDVSEVKQATYAFIKRQIFESIYDEVDISDLPSTFVEDNKDILLIDVPVSDEVKSRYYTRSLTLDDILENYEAFKDVPLQYFSSEIALSELIEKVGKEEFVDIAKNYPKFIKEVVDNQRTYQLINHIDSTNEDGFINAAKWYLNNFENDTTIKRISLNDAPEWINQFNFKFVDKISDIDTLMNYTPNIFILNESQKHLMDIINYKYLKMFEEETKFFSHKHNEYSLSLENFELISSFLYNYAGKEIQNNYFIEENISYEEWKNRFAHLLELAKSRNYFTDYHNYDWMQGDFRDKHHEIFMSMDAPEEYKNAFYKNKITPEFLCENEDIIPYLLDKDLLTSVRSNITYSAPMLNDGDTSLTENKNFAQDYIYYFGKEEYLKLLSRYGYFCNYLYFVGDMNNGQDSIEEKFIEASYASIKKSNINYYYMEKNDAFVKRYPELFVNLENLNIEDDLKQKLKEVIYSGKLSFNNIKKYPFLVDVLKDKDIEMLFSNYVSNIPAYKRNGFLTGENKIRDDLEFIKIYGKEKFLILCSKYGRYFAGANKTLRLDHSVDTEEKIPFDELCKMIENIIYESCSLGYFRYSPSDAPDFLLDNHPELFLDEYAPDELKKLFYVTSGKGLDFLTLSRNREWIPFIENKSYKTALVNASDKKSEMLNYFLLFGEEKGIRLGINKAETVTHMINTYSDRRSLVFLMKDWYNKTGKKFIPDYVIMENFPLEEADKFLSSGSNWSNLMRIENFASTPESREAMLKVAYSFGAFDNDVSGYKKLIDLLTDIPRHLDKDYAHIINNLKLKLCSYGSMTEEEYYELKKTLKEEGYPLNNGELFTQIYRQNEDGTYTLSFNTQSYPASTKLIRRILEKFPDSPVVSPMKAHQMFGSFELKYDPDFREFLLKNLDAILKNNEYASYLPMIQRQFEEIKTINSNRHLTYDLAISYVQSNKYFNIEAGNERVAEVSAIAGYSQSDFDTLQQIYNYGKQRVFSSIPRINNTYEDYRYQILSLSDPLALAIGTLTDCCQEIKNAAELCMEHSMTSKDGRVFVVFDRDGSIISQSWVWRNKDVLCFDNIEVPNKAFSKVEKDINRAEFSDIIYKIYEKAANELMKKDEAVYKSLLKEGKISKEQYEGLRLGKVTVGLGYNDIASSLKKNATLDEEPPLFPPSYSEPVKLNRSLYVNDSRTQYIISKRKDRKAYEGNNIYPHSDEYTIYTDENFSNKQLLYLERLELLTNDSQGILRTQIKDDVDRKKLVTEIAKNYGIIPSNTKIVMDSNFAVIYTDSNDIVIADLLFNNEIDSDKKDITESVAMQIKLALDQIANGKNIDTSNLSQIQLDMYKKAMSKKDNMDKERGI